MRSYRIIEKAVGETPLEAVDRLRVLEPALQDTTMTYAGRLDPMASGQLLILIGDECKKQTDYHALDKAYTFEILLGTSTDTGDVLGIIDTEAKAAQNINKDTITVALQNLTGSVKLPYPHFSSKTVQGKPLHTWAVEGRLGEIEIPTRASTIHHLALADIRTVDTDTVYKHIQEKIETIPPVTDTRKALGNDFRRVDVRASWHDWNARHNAVKNTAPCTILTIKCIASSGTYMRTLARVIGESLGTTGLAYSIHRTTIGHYQTLPFGFGFWGKKF